MLRLISGILLAPIAWLMQACNPLGKPVDGKISDNFYYNKSKTDIIYSPMGNWFELGKSPLQADANSFIVLNSHIGKDKQDAYYQQFKIQHPLLDLESFSADTNTWMWHTGMDKNHVYVFDKDIVGTKYQLITRILKDADPKTFRYYEVNWSKDQYHHFYRDTIIDVDYSSFQIVNEVFAKDHIHVYLYYLNRFERITADPNSFHKLDRYHAKDSSSIYFFQDYLRGEKKETLQTISYDADSEVQLLEHYHLVVKDQVYFCGHLLDEVDGKSVQVFSPDYLKDKNRVFFQGAPMPDADATTFYFDETEFTYRDKDHKYRNGEIWEGNQ